MSKGLLNRACSEIYLCNIVFPYFISQAFISHYCFLGTQESEDIWGEFYLIAPGWEPLLVGMQALDLCDQNGILD